MPIIDQTTVVDAWLLALLGGDAPLMAMVPGGLHPDVMPEEITVYPGIVWQLQAPKPDTTDHGPHFIMANLLYLVKAIDKGRTYGSLVAIVNRFTQLLQNASGSAQGGTVLSCQREMPWRLAETTSTGVSYRHLGATFNISAQ